ncbi:hypothetical protein LCGC14_2919380 [marine sediment metagenome]|uniref:Uncharacterized protein n=1 Tax=marine sediment metagenome TaxID=412755 RepID=A0A0F9AFC2_9ZZZZ
MICKGCRAEEKSLDETARNHRVIGVMRVKVELATPHADDCPATIPALSVLRARRYRERFEQ